MGKRELVALLNLSSWCLVVVERLFLTVTQGCLQFVIVVFPDHTHLLFMHDPQKKHRLGTVNKILLRPISSLLGAYSAYMIVCTYERLVNMVLGEALLFA